MTSANELTIRKPVALWNQAIKVEPRKFLVGLGKMVVEGVCQDWSDVGSAAMDTLDALGLSKKPEELAWLLIYRALTAALSELVAKHFDLFRNRPDKEKVDEISARFEEQMGRAEVTISPKFFDRPGELPLLQDLHGPLATWLQGLGAQQRNAEQIASRLPAGLLSSCKSTNHLVK